jgi:hypothetical protein
MWASLSGSLESGERVDGIGRIQVHYPLEYAIPHHETGMNSFDSLRFFSLLESGESWREAKSELQFLFAFAMSYFSTFNPPLSGKDQVIF